MIRSSRIYPLAGAALLATALLAVAPGAAAQQATHFANERLSAIAGLSDRSAVELRGGLYLRPAASSFGPWTQLGLRWAGSVTNQLAPTFGVGGWTDVRRIRLLIGVQYGVASSSDLRPPATVGRSPDTLGTGDAANGAPTSHWSTTDVVAGAEWRVRAVDMRATFGWRIAGARTGATWLSGEAAIPVAARVALLAGIDHRSSLGAGRIGGGKLAFTFGAEIRSMVPRRTAMPTTRATTMRPAIPPFRLVRTTTGGVLLFHLGTGCDGAELRGDVTRWSAVPLEQEGDGVWSVELPIAAGVHRIAVRCGEGPWTAPPGLPSEATEFGTTVGVLVLSPGAAE